MAVANLYRFTVAGDESCDQIRSLFLRRVFNAVDVTGILV